MAWNTSQSLLGRRERAKLAASNTKLRKMITDLKVGLAEESVLCERNHWRS